MRGERKRGRREGAENSERQEKEKEREGQDSEKSVKERGADRTVIGKRKRGG